MPAICVGAVRMCSPRAAVSPPQALGANARAIDFRQEFFLQRRIVRIGITLIQGQQQRFLGQLGHPLKVAANADAQHHGRARVRARVAHGLQHHPFHARQTVGRGKHFQLAHVLAAKAFGRHGELQRIPRHQLHMQDGRGVIPGIHPPQRVVHHGFAQQSFGVALADTLIHRGLEIPGDMHVLPHLGKHHRHARILADGHSLLPGNLLIAAQDMQDLPRRGKGLLPLRGAQGTADVLRQEAVGLHA